MMCIITNILVLSFFGLLAVSEGQFIQNGQCEDVPITLQANFNFEQFITGTWYEYARTDHPNGGDCSTLQITPVGVTNTVYIRTIQQNFLQDYHGTVTVPTDPARLTLTLPTLSNNPIDFWVWLTNYENFAMMYNCENVGTTQRRVFVWQLSKDSTTYYPLVNIPILMNNTMFGVLGITAEELYYVDHSEDACRELPAIQPGEAVILPGQCDDNITVVQNFSAGDFLGVWHEVYSYYSENSFGTCSRAQYSSQDGVVVNVVNSEVINQALFTVEGNATVISNDGSARLSVLLEVAPNITAQSELLIIATDYNQWAISYTCNNLANNQKRVFSWIVSRTRTLPAAAQAQVDAVVNSVVDLNYAFYQPTNQSDSACFYVPSSADGEAVFGGQCDQTIPVQANFVAANYLGLWHDIESFPTAFQFGTCANAYYSLGNVGVDVFNTQVVNETLDVINGVAIPVGNEAKLIVSFPIAGTNLTVETDYWIISTDYVSYSLVYSCRNINDYQQQITMWKLSRSKALTAQANTLINNVMASQTVFDQRFFQDMDQTREGCFYYPEPVLGEPVVFPGQCGDENVPVITNFNLTLFAGQWFEVQAYPKEFQPGSCTNHQFSVSNNTILNLVSTSVADQLLETTSGQLAFINGTDARFTLTTSNGTHPIEFPYYIIDTDYSNYALAYSCVNINDDFRGVYSWKLSRTKELSMNAIFAINTAMEQVAVLREEYFEPVDQSDTGCFYFPDLAPGQLVVLPGQCDSDSVIPVVSNFDAASYLGRWRLIESYPSEFQIGECNQARYSLANDGTVIVYNTEVANQTLREDTGVATLMFNANNQTIGKLQVTFPGVPVPFELWILDTDYDNYALVYGCVNITNQQRQVLSWKMSRTTNLTAGAVAAINAITSNVTVLNDRYYQIVDHSDAACFYYPEVNPSSSVVFPGQCDENINVVTNFDAVGYMGLWHDIERYPAPFQDGTCGNAFYTLLDGPVVDVFNTQVLNQTLDTIIGSAILANASDTSAKLLVTFPVAGFNLTSPYWVLATDYTNYALVYSCTNIDSENRMVTSWKLSRTKALSAGAVTVINQVMNSIDVLDDRYFIEQNQTTEGCFYFPEPQPGLPVVFPGQCDVNATVVQNFNLTAFAGIWHEIEAYPKEEEGGQCINHQFTLSGANTMNFESYNVIAESLGVTNGTVRYAFNDNSGRFFLDFVSNGTQISIPYWIIDTDYENYALAYSCVNQGIDYRGVWSWKLSRTKELSNVSRNAIDAAIEGNIVLDNEYYEPINQTADACFYLPEINPGEPAIFPGQCDSNIQGVANFSAAAYLGLWRTIETYASDFQLGTCGDATYSLNANGTVDVFNTEVINQTLSTINGLAEIASTDGTGKLLVTFPGAPFPSEYYVLATDYNNYALVYSCFNISNDQRRVFSWKLSRTNTLSQAAVTAINQVVSTVNVLNERYYETVDRSYLGCFYYPESNPSSSVVFRGQCDETIPVVTNFDAVGYMGLWHDIERYPAPFQDGTCGNAFYTLLDGPVVDVFNTQVLNQTLDTIIGSAILANASDTSAKLLVTFPVAGFNLTSPYWVLRTDYTSYALVYSCTNLDEYYKTVTSWKLSRSKTLSATAITAINEVVNSIDVLDDRYFIEQDQTAEGCFYFPEPQPGVPVVFPGQCDVNATVVQNFNLTAFAGIWHEIEAYPKEEEGGQCINHQFTLSGANTMNFESYNVIAESLGVTNGTVRYAFNDNSGRFFLDFVSNGTQISIPYWIIDTDYQTYALAYSCVNQGVDFRGVWSWKLSRTKELSNASRNAIDEAIQGNAVLDNVYYEPINQTAEACFYLPETNPGEPVIFPGQCDFNIRGVANFNAAAYLGLWRTIETYASDFQLGTCGDATYSLNANGTVDVFNTEVINQTLSTINGLAEIASTDGTGKLLVTFPGAPFPSEYYVLATDYNNYALVYSCFNISNDQRRVFSWKLSRTNTLSQAAVTAIDQVVSTVDVLNERYYEIVDRSYSGCFYYPESNPSSSVVFRGQCDETIPVVTNFDAVGYMGLWHDIERYPAPFQDGTCGNAFYTLLDGPVVDVFNTQVLNQTLDTIIGSAILANASDTSAKLLVTFPVAGFNLTSPYWVLRTDYTSYALVYSCTNLDEYYKTVTSWKLSRTKTLSATALTAINEVVNSINVLDDRYFIEQDQTAVGCFYFPEPQPGVPVVFPGQCDVNATVVQNFNLTAFAGIWHEIEAYPKEEEGGQCINHQFTLSGANTMNFESSNVIAESLGVTNGTVRYAFNDNSGRFFLDFVSNGTQISIPYWIIDTDYQNYALAYSCVNQGVDFRGVWSWKLSRTKELSNTSINSINEAIEGNTVLDNVYYESINQTAESCFYLPETSPGEPVIFPGQCDANIRGVANFNAAAYLGLWRTIETYASDFQLGTCGDATYSLNANGTVDVFNTEVINQTLSTINGLAEIASTDGTGKLLVTFPGAPFPSEYYILATDYNNYALVYSCFNISNDQRRVYSWKLSRTNTLSQAAVTAINQVVSTVNVLNERYYETVDRSYSGCFYYPESNPSSSVVFRGQCDETIPVVTNFDAVGYMGLWHDIERYPAPFQDGTCGNAFYTLLDGPVVDVFNTQVLNQTLDTIIGSAVLANASDTSAKLLVTFPVAGFNLTSPYWVLRTDYTSYALVYSCTNLDEYYKTVTSWKLSRSKTLSATALTAINEVMNSIDVLDDRYFEIQDQTSEGCFYFPEPEPGLPVVFPGQCDLNLTVVQNFNLSRFAGRWHEIEAYPKEEQTGPCVSHEFTLNAANNLVFESYNVIGESLNITSGTVITSTDNSARLQLQFISNGTTITIPYWIVDTDYDNYAVAYSCVNQNADFRGVWSWKLSRTKTFSPASNAAINNTIANIDVIDNIYFEPISQSDESCFYYPDLGPGEAVIFPGQCDTNITGIPNFNAARYLGLWRTIETYPSEFQLGDCGDATYSLNSNGSVDVFNTEVINQTLSTINGLAVLASNDGTGKLLVTFPGAPVPSEYYILATDYDNYALVYSCFNINSDQRRVFSWKLSRTNSLSQQAEAEINTAMNQVNVLDSRYYEVVNRTDEACFYFPEPDGGPVIFRGQCDQTIDVVMNFNATRYTGVWYDIQSYPAPFQVGSCGTATYDLDLSTLVVAVENTQVINPDGFGPVLDTQTGTAVLALNDTSAKLLVTFEVNGVNITTDYWVLATDYDNYALVYSCQNLNNDYRQVNSWKLSRARNLTAAAETAIATAIDRVQVLEQQYFVEGGQSQADCFFYPDNKGGDVLLEGLCIPDAQVPALTNFNASLFSGIWHEVARFPSDLQEGECTVAEYALGPQNSVSIIQSEVDNAFQSVNTIPGTLAADGRGVINAEIAGIPFNTFYILATDYSEYALLYGCRNIGNDTKQVYSWKYSRSREGLSATANNRIDDLVRDNIDLFENFYSYTEQTNNACFHYPEFEELPATIDLPGPCNESIRGVPNFDAAGYLGRWIEIERYPQSNQFGTCDRAYYSLGANNVLVRNTQVVGESLAQQLGSAVVASTDNSGLLNVTFVVNNITVHANYYVLATDYTNYALVYSCRNLTNGDRQVSSWKLSRTTSLSVQALSTIDSVVSQTQGLNQNYYKPTNQSEGACFFVPELNVNQAPVFRGQCAENVTGVSNFDASRYAGWWHEIERFPVDNYRGECISSQYIASGNAYSVTDTVVANGTATVSSGTVQITSDGRLRRTINGQVQDIWVLATDYETYSLLYSCENVDDEFMRIWSAKHSKSRQLTAAGNSAMAPVIEANRLLYPQFYQQVNQSDAACFHYPALTGQQVILPGQCDDNIPVMQNFDVGAYEGTWYQIERYPQTHENPSSICIGARYVLQSSGIVTVLNWEVLNGVLLTIAGNATIASTDGSAKFNVVLPVQGSPTGETVTTSLYVLQTDYQDYSLAYSCSNINAFQRSVGAWKLSRQRTLAVEFHTAINTYMASREELHQPYFVTVEQDPGCEEPSSGTFLRSSVIVMVICALWQILS